MAQILKQSTADDVLIGPFVDLTDAATAETGESPSVKLSKNGQTLATKNDVTTPVHDADGYYNCELDATDTNTVGTLILIVAASANAFPVRHEFQVVEEAVYDAMYGAASAGPLQATTAGRTLDILATGEVPIDFDTSIGTLAAAQIEASALDGKGDWNVGKTGYSLTQTFPTNFADMSITVTAGLVDITQTAADKVWSTAARLLTAGTNIALAKGVGLTGLNDIAATDVVSAGAITTLTGAVVNVTNVATLTGHTNQTGDSFARLGAPAGASVSADILAIDNFVDGLETTIGVAGAGLTDVTLNAASIDLFWNEAMVETTGAPAITGTFRAGFEWMFALSRNKITQTATLQTLRNDADGADLATSVVSDDATTYTRAEWST